MQGDRLGEPYGGKLVNRILPPEKAREKILEAQEMQKFAPFIDFVYDAEKIGIGAYSPLEEFMDEATFRSVVSENRLLNSLPWTMPIILTLPKDEDDASLRDIKEGADIALLDWAGEPFAIMHVTQRFSYDKDTFALGVYGTKDLNHPNVYDIYNNYGSVALAGKIDLIRRLNLPTDRYELTPLETRELFRRMEWRNIAAYQCRNPPHTAHEYVQRCTLEMSGIDGLLIHPVVGRLKKGDYKPEVILAAYKAVVDRYYPKERVVLSSISITMRYGGPKAVLFLAIVRKNYGATHYIVGRDQAGVGSYYEPYDCHRIFDAYDIGIIPVKYRESFYCRICGWMATEKTCPHPSSEHISTSQTRIRELLRQEKDLPAEILRAEVAEILKKGNIILE
jgi:sulfate adenylyltransferase